MHKALTIIIATMLFRTWSPAQELILPGLSNDVYELSYPKPAFTPLNKTAAAPLATHYNISPAETASQNVAAFSSEKYHSEESIHLWEGGSLVGTGYTNRYIGLGNIAVARVGVMQTIGNLSITIGVEGEKLHVNRDLHNNFGAYANGTLKLNDKLTLNVFGAYYNSRYIDMPTNSLMGTTHYGASIDYQINDRWGIEAGANRVYNPYSRKWETIPILAPSFKMGKHKIGIDFGSIIYSIFRSKVEDYYQKKQVYSYPAVGGANMDYYNNTHNNSYPANVPINLNKYVNDSRPPVRPSTGNSMPQGTKLHRWTDR